MASAVLFERHPLERMVRWRTVANDENQYAEVSAGKKDFLRAGCGAS